MFAKEKLPVTSLTNQENKITKSMLEDLYTILHSLTESDLEFTMNEVLQSQSAKFSETILKLNPLMQDESERDMKLVAKQILNTQATLQNEIHTYRRELELVKFNEMYKILSLAINVLVDYLNFKSKEYSPNLVSKIFSTNDLTPEESTFVKFFTELTKSYSKLAEQINNYSQSINIMFMFKPTAQTPSSFSTHYYKARDAVYKQTDHYMQFEEVLNRLSNLNAIFMPIDNLHKENASARKASINLLKKLDPILNRLQEEMKNAFEGGKKIKNIIDELKQDTVTDILSSISRISISQ